MRLKTALVTLFLTVIAWSAPASEIVGLRLMLHPDAHFFHLEQLAQRTGLPLLENATLTSRGALELTLPSAVSDHGIRNTLFAVRETPGVLWADVVSKNTAVFAESSVRHERGRELIVRVKAESKRQKQHWKALASEWKRQLGKDLDYVRDIDERTAIFALPEMMAMENLAAESEKLQTQIASIEYVEPNGYFYPHAAPNDIFYPFQWPLRALNAEGAWTLATGTGVNVAFLDTGNIPHIDIQRAGAGADLVTDLESANDGDGRDTDPTDPGNWILGLECGERIPTFITSSWHGTHVAGTIVSIQNNELGIAGLAPAATHVPVRVLGKCGGTFEDVAAGIRWAAGLTVAGLPVNANPAHVINMSLGGNVACPAVVQSAINDALARGVKAIVVSAGNDDGPISAPANCNGVIRVAASNIHGDRSFYSNFGVGITVTAPGGEGFNAVESVFSLTSPGSQQLAGFSYSGYQGTSMAAPHVAGVVALMLQRNRNLTAGQVQNVLQRTARLIRGGRCVQPSSTDPTVAVQVCGAGLIDARAATEGATSP